MDQSDLSVKVALTPSRLRLPVFLKIVGSAIDGSLANHGFERAVQSVSIVGKVGRMLFFCTGAVTHNFQIAFERLQYRVKWHVLDHIRPPSTLQNFQYSIETIFAF